MAKNTKKIDESKVTDVVASDEANTSQVPNESVVQEAATAPEQQPISGRAVFAVSRVDVGVAVHTAFLAEDGRLLQMPAVFPNLEYGLQQVDEMRQMLIQQFSATPPAAN